MNPPDTAHPDKSRLTIEKISLSFGQLQALNGVSLDLRGNEILAIIGPNGAGKTCLLNCINGFYRPQTGAIFLNGQDITHSPVHERTRMGIARTFQNIELFNGLTTLENLLAARHMHFHHGFLVAYIDYMGFQPCASWWEKTVPGIQLAHQLYKKRGDIPTLTYCATIGACMVWAEAVRNALKKVGYEKVDGPAIFEGYLGIKNFTAQGIFKEISYTREDLRGNMWLKICKFNKDGSISNVTDYMQAPWNLKLKAEMDKEKK